MKIQSISVAALVALCLHVGGLALGAPPKPVMAAEASGDTSSADSADSGDSAGVVGVEEDAPALGRDEAVVKKVIDSHMPAIKYCYNKELRKDASLSGTVVVRFTVNDKGDVAEAVVDVSTLENETVETCMVSEIKSWDFPEPRGGIEVVINYPFKFKGSR